MTRPTKRQVGLGLVEILIVLGIITVLALVLLPRLTGGGGRDAAGPRKAPAPRERAQRARGASYTQQINLAIQMYRDDNEGKNPPSLTDLKPYNVTDEMIRDPVTHQPLPYDPEIGVVGGNQPALPRVNGF